MNACAFVVGSRERSGALLLDLAVQLGFTTVLPFAGLADAERQTRLTPLCFFLFAEVDDPIAHSKAAQSIRFSGGRLIRFAPLIYFCRAPSLETIKSCIQLGFDDVIAGPLAPKRVAPRLERLVGTEQVYFETSSYFGPDRRNRLGIDRPQRDDQSAGQFRRLEITRSYQAGVNVLRDDLQIVL